MTRPIRSFTGQNAFLSNFHQDRVGLTVEHHFQAAKAADLADRGWVLDSPSPKEAKRRGRTVTLRPDWEEVKVGIMLDLLQAKFQDPVLRAQLRATGDAYLEEGNWWGDTYWGVSGGVGQNVLGRLLMQVRSEL